MREIGFRGRITQGIENAGQWVYWGVNGTDMIDAIDPDTIGQLTGLKDKNGKEIYEGDVLAFSYGIPGRYVKGEVEYINGTFFMHTKKNTPDKCPIGELEQYIGEFEVIGNIYEHPTLLED